MVAARPGAAAPARRTSCSSCSTTSATRSSAATAPTSPHPNIDRLAAGGVRLANFHTTALCSPTRVVPAHRAQPPLATAWAASPTSRSATPATAGRIPRENGFLSGDPRARTATRRYAVGKWHLTPEDETHMAAPRGSWPLGRGFDRWYGFHGGETHQFVPTLYHDNHAVLAAPLARRRLPPERRPRRPRDRVPRRPPRGRRRAAVLPLLRDRRVPLAAPRAAGVDRALPRPVRRRLGRVARARPSRASSSMGLLPGGHRAVAPPALGAGVGRPRARRPARSRRASWSASPASSRTPTRRSAGCSRFLDASSASSTTRSSSLVSDNGASAEGGARGSINDVAPLERHARRAAASCARASTSSAAPTAHNNYPWGWTMAGNTPFQRWKREVHEGGVADPCIVHWPQRHRGAGRDPPPVRARDRRAPDGARARRHRRRPTSIDGVAQSPIDGTSFAVPARRRRRAPSATPRSTSRCSAAAAIYHDGWKAVTFKPLGRMYDDGLDPDAPFDDDVWELYHVAEDFSECHDLAAAASPSGSRRWSTCGGRRRARNDVLPLDNRPLAALLEPAPDAGASDATAYVVLPRSARPVPEAVAVNVRNRSHTITAERRRARAARWPDGVLLALGSVLGGFSLLPARRPPALRAQPRRQGAAPRRVRRRRSRPARTRLGFAFDTHRPTSPAPDGCSSTTSSSARARSRVFTPMRFSITGGGLTCGYEPGPPSATTTRAPFPCNAAPAPRDRRRERRRLPRRRSRVRRDHVGAMSGRNGGGRVSRPPSECDQKGVQRVPISPAWRRGRRPG